MPTRGSTATRTPTSGPTRRRGLATAATMLPLALGLAGNMSTPGVSTQARHGGGNTPIIISCALPFEAIKQTHAIDSSCEAPGTGSAGPQAAQNEAKNNFCATGSPVNLNFNNFAQLQQAAESANIPFGGSLPPNRLALHNLLSLSNQGSVGEGSVVRVAAFVMDAHYSNVSKGESVNCQQPGNENNDIHIVLGQNAVPSGQKLTEAQECASVTAEISPHFRPDVWNPDNLNSHNAHLFRFTGQPIVPASEARGQILSALRFGRFIPFTLWTSVLTPPTTVRLAAIKTGYPCQISLGPALRATKHSSGCRMRFRPSSGLAQRLGRKARSQAFPVSAANGALTCHRAPSDTSLGLLKTCRFNEVTDCHAPRSSRSPPISDSTIISSAP